MWILLKVTKTELNKPLVMSEKNHEGFDCSTHCWTHKKHMKKAKWK